jgi:hypothetical protein
MTTPIQWWASSGRRSTLATTREFDYRSLGTRYLDELSSTAQAVLVTTDGTATVAVTVHARGG